MQHRALEPFGQAFVKQALHLRQTGGFQAFTAPACTERRPEAGGQLLRFLREPSLEEQRIAFLNGLPAEQVELARKNRAVYDEWVRQARAEAECVERTQAREEVRSFLEYCDDCVERFKAMRARVEQDEAAAAALERQRAEEFAQRREELVGKLIEAYPLAAEIKDNFAAVQTLDGLAALVEAPPESFKALYNDPRVHTLLGELSYERAPEEGPITVQEQTSRFRGLLTRYLQRLNKHGVTVPDLEGVDTASTYPLPEPVEPPADAADDPLQQIGEDLRALATLAATLARGPSELVLTPEGTAAYYRENVQQQIADEGLLVSRDVFLEWCWFVFQDFGPYLAAREEHEAQQAAAAAAAAPAKGKKAEAPPPQAFPPPARDDALLRMPDYFNLLGTRLILCVGPRRGFKSDFCAALVEQLRRQSDDFLIHDERAIAVLRDARVFGQVKLFLRTEFGKGLQAPKYLIVDQTPALDAADVAELNQIALELTQHQQREIEALLREKARLGYYEHFQQAAAPAEAPSARTPARGQKVAPPPVQQAPAAVSAADAAYSGVFKVYCFDRDFETFLRAQFGRACVKATREEIQIPAEVPDAVVEYQYNHNLLFIRNQGVDYLDEYLCYARYMADVRRVFAGLRYGVTVSADDAVVEDVGPLASREAAAQRAAEAAAALVRQGRANCFALAYEGQELAALTRQLAFKAARADGTAYNQAVADYAARVRQIYDAMDPKKLKQLQQAAPAKAARPEKGAAAEPLRLDDPRFLFGPLRAAQRGLGAALAGLAEANAAARAAREELARAETLAALQCANQLRAVAANEGLRVGARFRELIEQVRANYARLAAYGAGVNPEVRDQELIVNDQLVLLEQVNKLGNRQLAQLYQELQQLLRDELARAVQVNKKLPYYYVQNVRALIAGLVAPEPPAAEERAPEPKERDRKPAAQQSKQQLQAQQLQQQMQLFRLENDNQAALLVFCRYLGCVAELLQSYVSQRTALLALVLQLRAAQLGARVVCAPAERDQVPPKLAKQLEAQLALFDRAGCVQAAFEQQIPAAEPVGLDRLLEVLQQCVDRARQAAETTQFQGFAVESQELVQVDLAQSELLAPLRAFDAAGLARVDAALERFKRVLRAFAEQSMGLFARKQEELETLFAQTGAIIAQIAERMQSDLGYVTRVSVVEADGGFRIELATE